MAKTPEKRKNFWDEEEEDEELGIKAKRTGQTGAPAAPTQTNNAEEIDQKIHEATVLMEQTHQLYLHYFNGLERRPPIEKIRLLETKVGELQRNGANVTTVRFKIAQFLSRYSLMKELWERKLRELERNK